MLARGPANGCGHGDAEKSTWEKFKCSSVDAVHYISAKQGGNEGEKIDGSSGNEVVPRACQLLLQTLDMISDVP